MRAVNDELGTRTFGYRGLIEQGEMERVTPSAEVAQRLMADASAHVRLAGVGLDEDPSGAVQLCYDATRKAAAALLAEQGLRATTSGGHIAVLDAAQAQFNDAGGINIFGRLHTLRRRRNRSEYPDADSPSVNAQDAHQALNTAKAVIDATRKLLESSRIDRFE